MHKRRVAITGLGMVSPLGIGVSANWRALLAGESGVGKITAFDTTEFDVKIAGEVKGELPGDLKALKKMDPFIHYAAVASDMAMADIDTARVDCSRFGVCVGSGIGGIQTIEANSEKMTAKGPSRISPFFVPASIINMAAGQLSIRYGLQGPNIATVSACATASHALAWAMRMIQYGDADMMLSGGSEHAGTPLSIAAFAATRALSKRNDAPEKASRPWDKDRDGFVLSSGAGVLLLEEMEHAKRRGAVIYAELVGMGMSGDASHITLPAANGDGAYRCMQAAMADAGVAASDIGYINAHGTSTPSGDVVEVVAIKRVLGAHAGSVMVSSSKSMMGHLLGAAGGVEAIIACLALREGAVPPTINLDNPDEGCDLDFVPHTAREASNLRYALSNSFGFGGTNCSLLFKAA